MWLLIDGNNWFAADWYAAKASAPDIVLKRVRDVVTMAENAVNGEPVDRLCDRI